MKTILSVATLLAATNALSSAAELVATFSTATEFTNVYTGYSTNPTTVQTENGANATTGEWTQLNSGIWNAKPTGYSDNALAVSFWMKSDYDATNLSQYVSSTTTASEAFQAIWQTGDITGSGTWAKLYLAFGLAADGSLVLSLNQLDLLNSTAGTIKKDQWYNVGFAFYKGDVSIFVNGEKVAGKTMDTELFTYNVNSIRIAEKTKGLVTTSWSGQETSSGVPTWTGGIDEMNV